MAKKKTTKTTLRYTTRSLINLEKITGKTLPKMLSELEEDTSFTAIVQMYAAGANLDIDEAIDAIDDEVENGMSLEELIDAIVSSVEDSAFFKNPALAEAAVPVPKEKNSKA